MRKDQYNAWQRAKKELEALAASKPEPHPPSRLCMCDDCKPSFEQEPQAKCVECNGQGWTTQPDPRNGNACQVQCEPCLGTGEPQAQAGEPVKFGLWDSQWVNIVNDPALRDIDKEDAINLAVKNTERKCVENATKALAKKDAALKACVEAPKWSQNQRKYLDVCGPAITQAEEAME